MAHIAATQVRAVHPWQNKIALTAVLLPAAPALLMLREGGMLFPLLGGFTLLAAAPLAFRRSRPAFAAACGTTGLLLLVSSVLGVYLGLFIFLPSALLLPLAAFADPRRHRLAASALSGLACLVATVAGLLFGCMVVGALAG
ncbi:hypothetical protein J7E97_02810 [Streptomyces sp. ISL-66]|uniref:hypothetical protein n=1 Tax=Streptomyces sp. ISL-66 TaxID=2819186 RepID=UPI001BEBC4D9|nr:hypothetical protein [Streptomyces sp. ISL-66]MBT2466824.1 hypothetical protein [Streptomyces sp. ISL-66]